MTISIADAHGLPAALVAAVHAALGAVPGVHVHAVERGAMGDHSSGLKVNMTGWSPSLHYVDIDWQGPVEHAAPAFVEMDADTALAAIAPLLDAQVRRAADALAMGRALPLPVDGDPTEARPSDPGHKDGGANPCVRHLLLDRAMGPIALQDNYDLARDLPREIGEMHRFADAYAGGPVLSTSDVFVAEASAGRVAGRELAIDTAARLCTFDGRWIRIACPLPPEAVLAQLPGRPVRALMLVHPALDDRIIAEAEEDERDGGVAIRIEPDLASFAEVAGGIDPGLPEGVHVTTYASGSVDWGAASAAVATSGGDAP